MLNDITPGSAPALADPGRLDAKTTDDLVALLQQSLADRLEHVFLNHQAQPAARGHSFQAYLLFHQLYTQLATCVEDFVERAGAGEAKRLISVPITSRRVHEPADTHERKHHVDALLDRHGAASGWLPASHLH